MKNKTALIGLFFLVSQLARAQTFTVIKHFTGGDGANPYGGVLLAGDVLYGTTYAGGSSNQGTVFKVNPDGTGYNVLKEFLVGSLDGERPRAGLVMANTRFYPHLLFGTTEDGGSYFGHGTAFRLDTNGAGFILLKKFVGTDGTNPFAPLLLANSARQTTAYGTATIGGNHSMGTVFKLFADGSGFTVLKPFTGMLNHDGETPQAGLVQSGNVLFGTTYSGGDSDKGTVFRLNTDGSGYSVLIHFDGTNGARPSAGLVVSDGVLYGTTTIGGNFASGIVFRVNVNGTGYSVLTHFNGPNGAKPQAGLTLSGGVLYGTTSAGGSARAGTVFQIRTNGSGFVVLKHFSNLVNSTNADGAHPYAGLVLSSNILYGTTRDGGSQGKGVVFKLSLGLPPVELPKPPHKSWYYNLFWWWPHQLPPDLHPKVPTVSPDDRHPGSVTSGRNVSHLYQ